MRKKHFNFQSIIVVGVLLLTIFLVVAVDGATLASVYFATPQKKLPIYAVQTDENKVAISFDAAWGADKTEQIMDICDEYGVKATFFLVGFWIEDYPETAKKIAERGFEIGMHSSTHPDMTKLNSENQELELTQNRDIIYSVTGVKAKLFRPPFGAYNNSLISTCEKLDITPVQWSVDSLDWKGLTAGNIASRVCENSKNGSIVLFHNNSDNIIEGLKMVLEFFAQKDFTVVPVGELVYKSNYTINSQGIQIKN